ncbi:hypothetical protein LIER_28497 [Lithospermum erythrorhizon]|uniref:Nodulin-like domain-containing protein n=1 Tax=Lithospermum erythrorhizon TaxID=34254 RepID=A0AAV3RHT4_LITER
MALQWLSLIGTIWLQCITGTNTNFPAYSTQLKKILSLSQTQLNNLAFASDAGKLLGWISGIAASYLPLWLVLFIGSSLGLIGYGVQFLFLADKISSLSYVHIFLLTMLAGNSICWLNTVCYIVTIKNFPLDRQLAVGISTSYVGLCAKIFTDIVDVVNTSSASSRAENYLLLNAILPLIVCFFSAPLLRELNLAKSRNLVGGFVCLFVITIVTGSYAVISSLDAPFVNKLPNLVDVIVMGVLLVAPLLVPAAEKIRETMQKKCWVRREMRVHAILPEQEIVASGSSTSFPSSFMEIESQNDVAEERGNGRMVCGVGVKEEVGVKVMLKRVDFWLYFFAYFFGATIGLVFLNNLGQIAESRGSSATSSLVSLSSAFSFFGRLIPSLLDFCSSKKKTKISRPALITTMMAPMAGAFFLLINKGNIFLHISTSIVGISTGAITSIAVSTTTELFGTKKFGINHNVLVANIPIGSYLFGDLAALLYNRAGNKDGSCIGVKCYETTFIIWGCLCSFGTFLAFILHARTRKFYSQIA